MRDESDLEVLYSEDVLDADILVASDDDFFDTENPPGDSCANDASQGISGQGAVTCL
jgi:hypothetical protein